MLTDLAQRWRSGRASYRPARAVIDTRAHEVAPILDDGTAKRFVLEHHYSGSYPAARARFGLWRGETLVGVAVYAVPVQGRCLDVIPGGREGAVELSRLVLLDDVPANGESWFVARTFELLRAAGFEGVLSHADPVARVVDGITLFPGHIGTIYQATNAVYFGLSAPRTLRLLPSGKLMAPRALTKIRKRERGHAYAEEQLVAAGAAPMEFGECPQAWLARWLPRLTTPLRHTGQHRYAWALRARGRRHLPAAQPYPKAFDVRQLELANSTWG
jgi:hypothetical protein